VCCCFVGICKSHDLRDTEAVGTAEVSGGTSETTTGIHSAATPQDSGTSGEFFFSWNPTWAVYFLEMKCLPETLALGRFLSLLTLCY
jgi:hypothetical protein